MKDAHLLEVDGLSLCLKTGQQERQVVDNLSFTLQANRILGLIGESGCGKSLSCLAVMRLLPKAIRQTGGTIQFDGQSIDALAFSRMRTIRGRSLAMIMQNPMSCFDAVFTVGEHFKETLASHPDKESRSNEERIHDSLHAVGFNDPQSILGLYPFQMSGGMLQRAMVALALMMNVKLLIADEPTTDPGCHRPGKSAGPAGNHKGYPWHGHSSGHPRSGGNRTAGRRCGGDAGRANY